MIDWLDIRSKMPFLGRKFRYSVSTESYKINNLSLSEADEIASNHSNITGELSLIYREIKEGIEIVREYYK